jgi:CelD/BcsL family acetyltransferase involved in cellulose biosynthesis
VAVQLCRSWPELAAHRDQWEALLEASPAATIFATPEWLEAWWTAFAPQGRLMALLFRDGSGELIGLALLHDDVRPGPLGTRQARLRLVGDGSGDSDNLDLVLRPSHERRCVEAFLSALERTRWDVCELNTLPADSPALPWLLSALRERGWVHDTRTTPRLVIRLAPTWEGYLSRLSRNERWKIVSQRRRLESRHRLRIRRCADERQLRADLDTLFALHQKRWQARGEPGSFASPQRRSFYLDLSRRLLARGWLEFWVLEKDDGPLAAQFCFRYRDTVYLLQEGFDTDYVKDRPGAALRAAMLEQLIAEGVRCYDFLGGDAEGKRRWAPEASHYIDVHLARPKGRGARSLRRRRAARLGKEWLREHAPPALFEAARRAYRLVAGSRT